MKLHFHVLVLVTSFCVSVWSKELCCALPGHSDSINDLSTDERNSFEECCFETQADSGEYVMHWSNSQSVDVSCRCAQYIEMDSVLNYWSLHYCTLRKALGGAWAIVSLLTVLVFIALYFFLLASTADYFLVPTLQSASDALQLTPTVAGATLLALANGAPDFAVTVAGTSGASQVKMVIGAIVGGFAFVAIFVLGVCLITHPFHTSRRPILREISFNFLAIGALGVVTFTGELFWWYGLLMLLLYAVYLVLLIFAKRWKTKFPKLDTYLTTSNLFQSNKYVAAPTTISIFRRKSMSLVSIASTPQREDGTMVVTRHGGVDSLDVGAAPKRESEITHKMQIRTTYGSESEIELSKQRPTLSGTVDAKLFRSPPDALRRNGSLLGIDEMKTSGDNSEELCATYGSLFGEMIGFWKEVVEWKEQNQFGRILSVIEFPVLVARIITVPLLSKQLYNRELVAVSVTLCPVFVLFAFRQSFFLDVPVVWGLHAAFYTCCLLIGAFTYLFVLKPKQSDTDIVIVNAPGNRTKEELTDAIINSNSEMEDECPAVDGQTDDNVFSDGNSADTTLPTGVWFYALTGISLLSGVAWVMLLANELLSLLTIIAMCLGVSDAFAGMTLLAWGNSVGDLVANRSMALSGNPEMAVTACLAGPIFNVLVSLGLAIFVNAMEKPIVFSFGLSLLLKYLCVPIGVMFALMKTVASRYHMNKTTGIGLLVIYVAFVLVSLWPEIDALGAPQWMKPKD